jgi:hypothetical protein
MIGPGLERLAYETSLDRTVIDVLWHEGTPDYVWAPSDNDLFLLFLAADRAVHLQGPTGARRVVETRSPIPDDWLSLLAPEDRDEVRARRADLAGRARLRRPGWCDEDASPPPAPAACMNDPQAAALLAEIRRRVMEAWHAPDPVHGGERVLVRFALDGHGALAGRCTLGATSPSAALTVLAAFDAAFPVEAPRGGAACLVGAPVVVRLDVAVQ